MSKIQFLKSLGMRLSIQNDIDNAMNYFSDDIRIDSVANSSSLSFGVLWPQLAEMLIYYLLLLLSNGGP